MLVQPHWLYTCCQWQPGTLVQVILCVTVSTMFYIVYWLSYSCVLEGGEGKERKGRREGGREGGGIGEGREREGKILCMYILYSHHHNLGYFYVHLPVQVTCLKRVTSPSPTAGTWHSLLKDSGTMSSKLSLTPYCMKTRENIIILSLSLFPLSVTTLRLLTGSCLLILMTL